ncbi:M56 family metallopeptidase [Nocardioides sp. W3-2-3]|uniref:M56 family metallopeptidase n=1 Tax=Nocardioides convexus TaxID=2712224 RepID=UPI00241847FB|nr:M56 family metallopeptidase [Nocardioides convexus]NHA01284.1 M56 family metallopeptidase [Nocardioides convexus]
MLDLVGRTGVVPGALVLDHDEPYAFCIGGRRHRVVVTEGLLATLDQRELEAVLAHESAHLHQRHHLALMLSRTLFGTLSPFFPAFGRAMSEVRLLAEFLCGRFRSAAGGCSALRYGTGAAGVHACPSGDARG